MASQDLIAELHCHIQALAGRIGPRSVLDYSGLIAAADYIQAELPASARQPFTAAGREVWNIAAELPGSEETVIVGAHYDTVFGQPGANDNGSGVAAVLALARRITQSARTLRFVLFANEEPPWFQTAAMGSLVYANACRKRGERIVAMLSLETIGYYSDEPGSQAYPGDAERGRPDLGNFIALVGDERSARLLDTVAGAFGSFPVQAGIHPAIDLSDHWSFWRNGYPALLVTDTAMFRYPHYHTAEDTPDKLDYPRFAQVVAGLEAALRQLTDG